MYESSHSFKLSDGSIFTSIVRFFQNGIYGHLELAFENGVFLVFAGLAVVWIANLRKREAAPYSVKGAGRYSLLVYGVVLLLLSMFPFIVTRHGPTLHGWDTRNALLIGLPVAIILVGIFRATFYGASADVSRIVKVALSVLVLAFSISTINNYLALQARWIKDRSIMANLSKMEEFKPYSIFVVQDNFLLPRVENRYRIYEWSSFFEKVWGGESRIGIEPHMAGHWLSENAEKFSVSRLKLSELDVSKGRWASLTIERGSQANSNAIMSARYFLKRFVRKNTLDDFLEGVVKIDLAPIEL